MMGRRPPGYRYAIDVLADGSEGAGSGSVFLSVHRVPPATATVAAAATATAPGGRRDEEKEEPERERASPGRAKRSVDDNGDEEGGLVLVARYAVSGVGSDLLSRAASDQRFKLGGVRAVLSGSARCSLWALPSLQAALRASGAGELSVVCPAPWSAPSSDDGDEAGAASYVERVTGLLHSRCPHPAVRTCQVPTERMVTTAAAPGGEASRSSSRGAESEDATGTKERAGGDAAASAGDGGKGDNGAWWRVYEDEFVRVHARSVALLELVDRGEDVATKPPTGDGCGNGSRARAATLAAEGVAYLYTLLGAGGSGGSGSRPSLSPSSPSSPPSLLVIPPIAAFPRPTPSPSASRFATWLDRVLDPGCLPVDPNSVALGLAIQPPFPSCFFNDAQGDGALGERGTKPTGARSCRRGSDFASALPWYWTRPSAARGGDRGADGSRVLELDPNLLVRAARQARDRHDRDPSHFPWSHRRSPIPPESTTVQLAASSDLKEPPALPQSQRRRLKTGQTLWLSLRSGERDSGSFNNVAGRIVDRTLSIRENRSEQADDDESDGDGYLSSSSDGRGEDPELDSRSFVRGLPSRAHSGDYAIAASDSNVLNPRDGSRLSLDLDRYDLLDDPPALSQKHRVFAETTSEDDNEIDLDGCLDEDTETQKEGTIGPIADAATKDVPASWEAPSVDLLCLGTGCAAPSPHRGSSGYALLLDPTTTLAIDAGEGFVTQWNRHAQHRRCLSTIRVIWISHAQ
jgi:hypothetical protein